MAFFLTRLRAIAGLAATQLSHYRWRTLLAVFAVAIAVLLVTLLSGLGYGVMTRGMDALDHTNRDLWMGKSPELAPGSVGGIDNRLVDAHEVTRRVESHRSVKNAQAISFQTVYVGSRRSKLHTLVGVGITGTSAPLPIHRGPGFERRDVHYANGTYDGEWTREVIVDQGIARRFNVSVGETLHIGGTLVSARANEFTVVGVSSTFSQFIGTPTVVLHLSELQEITATTGTDSASLIAITVDSDAETQAVAATLQNRYPEYSVRTNREQLRTVLKQQGPVIAAVVSLVVLALVVGLALVSVTLALLVHHQKAELATLRANGVSLGGLLQLVVLQGIVIGLLGGGLGISVTPVASIGLNTLIAEIVGSDHLVVSTKLILGGGFGIAVGMGSLGSTIAAWQIVRIDGFTQLR